jgi:toxin ParE1/3/4
MKLYFLESARRDLLELRVYLLKYRSTAIWRLAREQIREKLTHIAQRPYAGVSLPELTGYASNFRQQLTQHQRLIYRIDGDQLYLHIICAHTQDFEDLLLRRLTQPWQPANQPYLEQ